MDKRKDKTSLDDFVSFIDEINEVNQLAEQRQDNRDPGKKANADKSLRQYAHETAKRYIPDYDANTNPENLDPEFVQQAIKTGQENAKIKAESTFFADKEAIIRGHLSQDSLEKLASTKEVVDAAKDKDKEVIQRYLAYASFKNFVEQYEKTGEVEDEKQQKLVVNAVVKGVVKAQEDRLKDERDIDFKNNVKGLAALAASRGYIAEDKRRGYALAGLREIQSEFEAEYKKAAGGKGDVAESVRNTLLKMADGSQDDFKKAYSLVYAAEKGKLEQKE